MLLLKATGHKFGEYVVINPFEKRAECERCDAEDVISNSLVYRVKGKTRYETSLEIADFAKATMAVEKFNTIIIASGKNFADALAGTYLADVKDAPILMASGDNNAQLKEYIDANLVSGGKVYILGGDAAVPYTLDEVLAGYDVQRLKGKTRFETNIEILKEAGVTNQEIMVCSGYNFADSLAASATGRPILLVDTNKDKLNETQKAYLAGISTQQYYVIGGTAAVSDNLAAEVDAYGNIERVKGKTRYETSVAIAERFFAEPDAVILAYAWDFPDGLCGGTLATAMGAPIILTDTGKGETAKAYVQGAGAQLGAVLGGTARIDDATAMDIFNTNKIIVW